MLNAARSFFKPNKELRTLTIMEILSREDSISQQELGERTNMSGAMVNQYLKQLLEEQCIRYIPRNQKCYDYKLTSEGDERRRRTLERYFADIVRSYAEIKSLIRQDLDELAERGMVRLALHGASETCEVTIAAMRDSDCSVVALLDKDPAKHGQEFMGHRIQPPEALKELDYDAVLITSFGRQQEIYEDLVDGMDLDPARVHRI